MNYDIDFLFVKALQAELYPCNLSGRLFREKVCLRHRPPPTNERPNNWGPTLQMAAFHFNSQIGRGIPPRNKLTKLSRHGIYQKSTAAVLGKRFYPQKNA